MGGWMFSDSSHAPSGLPHVRFLCGVTHLLKKELWVFKSGGGIHLSRQQVPLKLAWAISIHKSQVSTGLWMEPGSTQGAGGHLVLRGQFLVLGDSF